MATTKVDICSTALIMIGANSITSFSDDSTEANVCNVVYEDIVKSALTRHRWRFATEQKQLSLLTASPTGRFTFRQDESEFPPHFILALEYSLAGLFAGSIARDSGMIKQFSDMAERQYLIAKNIDSAERTNSVIDHSRFINLRKSTRSTG